MENSTIDRTVEAIVQEISLTLAYDWVMSESLARSFKFFPSDSVKGINEFIFFGLTQQDKPFLK